MWWGRTLVLGLLAAPLLAGCGFHSVYGSHDGAATVTELAQVRINPISDRVGQVLRNYLSDRMEPTGLRSTRYTLDVSLAEQRADLGIQKDSTITFSRLTLTASYILKDVTSGTVLLTGNARADDSYNQLEGGFPSLSTQDDARKRAAQTVGDEIVARLSLFLRNRTS
jgi:LPS-assembly lipoprotein